jgi:hypothetical protein
MSEAVTHDGFRRRVAAHMAGNGELKPIAFIAFGDGGHNPDNTAKPTNSSAEALYHEVFRKPISALIQEDLLSATGKGVVETSEITGTDVISESALLDADGNIICSKTFAPKYLEGQESYGVNMKLRF